MTPTFRTTILAAALATLPLTATAQGFDKGLEFAKTGNFEAALKEWHPLAEQGHAKAQTNLGIMYLEGEGVLKDAKKGAHLSRLAAEQGHAMAQSNLGNMYLRGEGVLKDAKKSRTLVSPCGGTRVCSGAIQPCCPVQKR